MARTVLYSQRAQGARAKRSKTLLLPMPRASADELSLQVHIALDAMRRGRGCVSATQTLCQTMILVGLLAELGYGTATYEQMQSAESVISAAFDRGRDSDIFRFDDGDFEKFATIVTTYDAQLQRAPMSAIAEASNRLDRFRARESFEEIAGRFPRQ